MNPCRVGVIGCGRIAQIMHLPFLDELEQFSLVALADVSEKVLDKLGPHYPRADCYRDYSEILGRPDIDAVAVCTPDHALIAEQAALAGKHVFVEKPLCFTRVEGDRLTRAVAASGVRLMVGYMRCFDPTFRRLVNEIGELGDVRMARARDVLGLRSFHGDVYTLASADETGAPDRSALHARLAEALGTSDLRRARLYLDVLMLGVHDFSTLRLLLGPPLGLPASTTMLGPRHLVATLAYERDARALVELGVWPTHSWSETELVVVTDDATASLSFPDPYIRYLPTTLLRRSAPHGEVVEQRGPHSNRSMFREEWLEFHDAIASGRDPITGLAEGLADVELAAAIVLAIPDDQLDAVLPPAGPAGLS